MLYCAMKKIQSRLKILKFPFYKYTKWYIQGTISNIKSGVEHMLWKYNGGYKCIDCGNVTRYKTPQYEGYIYGRRMLLSNSIRYGFGKTLCPHCLANRIELYFRHAPMTYKGSLLGAGPGTKNGTCDFSKQKGPVVDVIFGIGNSDNLAKKLKIDVRFGAEWWNGFNVGLPAIRKLLLEDGIATTGILVLQDGKISNKEGRVIGKPQPVSEIGKKC